MNVVLQCLLSSPAFVNLLSYLRDKPVDKDSLTARFLDLYSYFDMSLHARSVPSKVVKAERIFATLLD